MPRKEEWRQRLRLTLCHLKRNRQATDLRRRMHEYSGVHGGEQIVEHTSSSWYGFDGGGEKVCDDDR
jgi:hypothetical protein